jgi:hypothetical protein
MPSMRPACGRSSEGRAHARAARKQSGAASAATTIIDQKTAMGMATDRAKIGEKDHHGSFATPASFTSSRVPRYPGDRPYMVGTTRATARTSASGSSARKRRKA